MTTRTPTSWFFDHLHPAARDVARRLVPVMVLIVAAALGLAAVAMA